jgi:predicted pyridoxine 5'-phosphate oxidase superfamily flavin-nucleotide-binding protein
MQYGNAEGSLMRLDDDMRRVVREQGLGFAATVCPDGTPNLSPKGTTIVWDDEHLVFLDLHSPGTVANLAANPSVEINVVDPIVRKGYRFRGHAVVFTNGELHAKIVDYFRGERGIDPQRVHAVVLVRVDVAAPLVSPAYESGATEAEVGKRWRDHHLSLAATRLHDRTDTEPPRE